MADHMPPHDRKNIIRVIQTPLGFFTLVVLVTEFILVATVPFTSDLVRSITVLSMILLIFFLVIIVTYLARTHPEALFGSPSLDKARRQLNFTPGQEVTIRRPREKELLRESGVITWDRSMEGYVNATTTIKSVNREMKAVKLDIDSGQYTWAYEWIENK